MGSPDGLDALRDQVALLIKRGVSLAVEAEREACIRVAEDVLSDRRGSGGSLLFDSAPIEEVIRRIRDRKYRP